MDVCTHAPQRPIHTRKKYCSYSHINKIVHGVYFKQMLKSTVIAIAARDVTTPI